MIRRRLTAFDVSFPEDRDDGSDTRLADPSLSSGSRTSSVGSATASISSLGKRKSNADGDSRASKRLHLLKSILYKPRVDEIREDEKLIIDGEDPYRELEGGNADDIYEDLDDSDDGGGGVGVSSDSRKNDNDKPIRELYDFYIFDPKHQNELVSLELLEIDDGVDRSFEAVGRVKAHFVSDEDDGQEEDELEEVGGDGGRRGKGDGKRSDARRIRLSTIMRVTVDYTKESEPFYIETMYAWYILVKPADAYTEFYKHFYERRRVAQIAIAWAFKRPNDSYATFLGRFTSRVDMFGHTYVEQDLSDSASEIQQAIFDDDDLLKIKAVPFVRHITRNVVSDQTNRPPPRRHARGPRGKHLPKSRATIGNIDLAVLKAENQNATHVTPRIAKLAQGLFREDIEVVGPPPPPINKTQMEIERKRQYMTLKALYRQAKKARKKVDYKKEDRISVGDDMYKAVQVDGVVYKIGDVILTPREIVFKTDGPVPHLGDRIDNFFWFGRIHYIIMHNQTFHVEWFYHGSQSIMDEVAHPQELFLSDQCGSASLHEIAGKVKLVYFAESDKVQSEDFFCKFMYDHTLCSFEHIDQTRLNMFSGQSPPNNCLSCALREERDIQVSPLELTVGGQTHGLAFAGKQFHLEDFVLYRAESGPCHIGYIVGVVFERQSAFVTVRKVGRISGLERILPAGMIKDERHLYLTDEKAKVNAEALIDIIYAPCIQSFQGPDATLEDWLNLSYRHFYLRYSFCKLAVKSWKERRRLSWQDLYVCTPCCKERLKGRNLLQEFLQDMKPKPLPTLDLFAGVGAFSRGLKEGSECLKVTHAIEIGPSAAKTLHRNSPDTIVYNQCANIILRYAIKSQQGHATEVPKQLLDGKRAVPPPPKPGDIKVIVGGLPCQSHSTLNMFKKADDVKSNLILTALSYVDFYKPTYAFFENVPGFVNFHLQADRANLHGAKGEIEKGGLKLFIRALIDMNYQVRFCFLQAAHYGTPQRRVRFFLIAAKEGCQLPEFPQPTHDYPEAKDHVIKYYDGEKQLRINPICGTKGIARHPIVTIWDAIGDLPQFDWEHPNPRFENHAKREERRKRAETIRAVKCKKTEPYCGFTGTIGYHHQPKTTFQYQARLDPTVDIQHYTKCILPQKVVRVLNIPIRPGADYRDLPTNQLEWGVADPMSSVAQLNYRRGIYGRLNSNSVFPTTVTNVDPTAKQSQVLHPFCHRMVTVRELARSQGFPDSFVFEAIGQNIVTIHRQIGNAVPLQVAHALGRQLRKSLFEKWKTQHQEVIVIDDDGHDGVDEPAGPRHYLQVRKGNEDDDDDDEMDIYE